MRQVTIPDLLRRRAAQDPAGVAVVVDGGGTLTFAEWDARSDAVAGSLTAGGVRAGDRVGLRFDNRGWIQYAVAYCGAHKAGAVPVPFGDVLGLDRIDQAVARYGIKVVVHAGAPPPPAGAAWTPTFDELARGGGRTPPEVRARPADEAEILFTSGTTGQPKAIVATHANLAADLVPPGQPGAFSHSQHLVHAFPLGTEAGQLVLLGTLTTRPTAVTLPAFDPRRFCYLVESYRAGTVLLVPAMVVALLHAAVHEDFDLSSVLLVSSTGAPLPPTLAARLADVFPNAVAMNTYGTTESAPARTTMLHDPARPGSVGRPTAGAEVRVTDADGRVLPLGETGLVWLRSPGVPARRYLDDQHDQADVFRDGWVRTGDLGFLDQGGYLFLVDRERDVVNVGGLKVSTLQVEAALHRVGGVVEAAAFAIPHPVLGQAVAAAVVTSVPVPAAELQARLRQHLAGHEVPVRVLVLPELPYNQAGKVRKAELQARLAGDLAPIAAPAGGPVPPADSLPSRPRPLGAMQELLWRRLSGTAAPDVANLVVAVRVHGRLDVAALQGGIEAIVRRHEVLRSAIRDGAGGPVQQVEPANELRIRMVDLVAAAGPAARGADALALVDEEARRPFAPATPPLVRVTLARLGTDDNLLLVVVSRLGADRWSIPVLLRELEVAYGALHAGRPPPLPPLALQYTDVVAWERQQFDACVDYWRSRLDGAPPRLGAAAIPGSTRGGAPRRLQFDLGRVHARVRAATRQHRVRLPTALLAAWAGVLGAWTDSGEVVVATPLPGRTRPEAQPLIGCLARPVLVRLDLVAAPTWAALLGQARAAMAEAARHQYYPYAEIQRMVPDPARCWFERRPPSLSLPGVECRPLLRDGALVQPLGAEGWFDLDAPELVLEERGGALTGTIVHDERFDASEVAGLADGFRTAVETLAATPEAPLRDARPPAAASPPAGRPAATEPAEVQRVIAAHPAVADSRVVRHTDQTGSRLVAHVVLCPGNDLDASGLRRFLLQRVPDEAVPAAFLFAEQLPRDGQEQAGVDPPPAPAQPAPSAGPRDATEALLCEVWAELLGIKRVGIHDDVFDLGAHSLTVMRAAARILERTGVDIPGRWFYEEPTVAGLARLVAGVTPTGGAC